MYPFKDAVSPHGVRWSEHFYTNIHNEKPSDIKDLVAVGGGEEGGGAREGKGMEEREWEP